MQQHCLRLPKLFSPMSFQHGVLVASDKESAVFDVVAVVAVIAVAVVHVVFVVVSIVCLFFSCDI